MGQWNCNTFVCTSLSPHIHLFCLRCRALLVNVGLFWHTSLRIWIHASSPAFWASFSIFMCLSRNIRHPCLIHRSLLPSFTTDLGSLDIMMYTSLLTGTLVFFVSCIHLIWLASLRIWTHSTSHNPLICRSLLYHMQVSFVACVGLYWHTSIRLCTYWHTFVSHIYVSFVACVGLFSHIYVSFATKETYICTDWDTFTTDRHLLDITPPPNMQVSLNSYAGLFWFTCRSPLISYAGLFWLTS